MQIEKPKQATRIIPINLTGDKATVLNKLQKLTGDFNIYNVTQLRILTRTKFLTRYTSAGVDLPVLLFDDAMKVVFNLHKSKDQKVFESIPATSFSDETQNKQRFNCDQVIDFYNSTFLINTAISEPGWLLLQFTYKP